MRPVRDDIKCPLASHITKIVDELLIARRVYKVKYKWADTEESARDPATDPEAYPHYTDDTFYEELAQRKGNREYLDDSNNEYNDDSLYDEPNSGKSNKPVPRSSSYIETPVYDSDMDTHEFRRYNPPYQSPPPSPSTINNDDKTSPTNKLRDIRYNYSDDESIDPTSPSQRSTNKRKCEENDIENENPLKKPNSTMD